MLQETQRDYKLRWLQDSVLLFCRCRCCLQQQVTWRILEINICWFEGPIGILRGGEPAKVKRKLCLKGWNLKDSNIFEHLPTILSLKIPIDFPVQIWPKTLFCFGIMPSIKKPRRRRRTLFVSRWWPLTLLMKPWHFGRSQCLRAAMVTEIKKATLPK